MSLCPIAKQNGRISLATHFMFASHVRSERNRLIIGPSSSLTRHQADLDVKESMGTQANHILRPSVSSMDFDVGRRKQIRRHSIQQGYPPPSGDST